MRIRHRVPTGAAWAALCLAAVTVLSACTSGTGTIVTGQAVSPPGDVTGSGGSSGSSSSTPPTSSSSSGTSHGSTPKIGVQISLLNADGSTYGVGMPVIAYFSRRITDASALQKATTVKVNGQVQHGAWMFETSDAGHGPIEAHFRLRHYWPANAHVYVNIPVNGLSAGGDMVYSDSLFSSWNTGDAHISTVSNARHTITVTDNRKLYGRFPVSLGIPDEPGKKGTPTVRGTKVIMEQGADIRMVGPGYDDPHVKWTQRLTYDGEYLHAAPWNCISGPGCTGPYNNIGHADSSNGCTNLVPGTAEQLFKFMRIGDVVKFPDATGPKMTLGEGYGDWNVPWSTWLTGGLVHT